MIEPEGWDKLAGLNGLSLEAVDVGGVRLGVGGKVRLCPPSTGTDIMDRALAGKSGVIESIEQSYEGEVYLAVVLDDDPGRELGFLRQPGHRFFFRPSEVEPQTPAHDTAGEAS